MTLSELFDLIGKALAFLMGKRAGQAEETAREKQAATDAENTALKQKIDVIKHVDQETPDQLQEELRGWTDPQPPSSRP